MAKTISFLREDTYTEVLFNAGILMAPLTAVGNQGNQLLMYISTAVGLLFLLAFLFRICYRIKHKTSIISPRLSAAAGDLLYPYVIALCAFITSPDGSGISLALWFAAILFVLTVISYLVEPKQK